MALRRPLTGWLLRLDGLIGERGSRPRDWRLPFVRRGPARDARDRVLAWRPQRLIVAHGACVESDAAAALARAHWPRSDRAPGSRGRLLASPS